MAIRGKKQCNTIDINMSDANINLLILYKTGLIQEVLFQNNFETFPPLLRNQEGSHQILMCQAMAFQTRGVYQPVKACEQHNQTILIRDTGL